ncbi:DUF1450 domain-containing protein [Paenibacillus alkalitolerans]|uniref:DUF1450 domain-containing protein n=1 Tax=Paenibacillus alkalitolerans TaxID=2799335 RepID=UPI0018F2AB27|nr:DUF1450 domain-containing protein [Paenibacillus alkalitolerans]
MKINYCCKNLKRCEGKTVYKSLKQEFPDVKQKKKDCLGRCGSCKKGAIAKVGKGSYLCAASPDDLYAEIKKLLAQTG